ncbi:MAG: isoprenylcysteine carboxylmethyltransferase family protein [Bacteroidales bacterium]|nr:isoprenylcysteine carboxylmethyltransferase family protein [Bacteroidales bacterium]
MMIFYLFIVLIILLRIGELLISKRNEKWLLKNGAIEYGSKHYPFMIMLHFLFFISLMIEYITQQTTSYSLFFMVLYFLLIAFKTWIILSLGKFWTTKIYHIKGFPLIKNGLYKYLKHPNYLIVVAEIAVIPLAFHLYYTAVIFTLLNWVMLVVRIKEENKALQI